MAKRMQLSHRHPLRWGITRWSVARGIAQTVPTALARPWALRRLAALAAGNSSGGQLDILLATATASSRS